MNNNKNQVSEKKNHKKFKSDLSALFETKTDSDVILMAGNQEFSAHKAILTAKSVVFAAMFENQMRENIENKVEIKDIDPEVLEVMLLYIYTGDVRDMDKIGAQLMTAADKYFLDQLKIICSQHLIRNMSLNTAIESLILSKLINDSDLKRSPLEFIRDNIIDVIKTKDWNNLKKSNSELLEEIILFSTNNHSIEAKINCNLTQLTKFKTIEWKIQESKDTEIRGIEWRIFMASNPIPEITKFIFDRYIVEDVKYLGVYICCGLPGNVRNFSCNIQGEIRLISIKQGIPDIKKKFNKIYNPTIRRWGFDKFERLDTLLDPNNGYIRDDTIILEANIIVDPPKGDLRFSLSKAFNPRVSKDIGCNTDPLIN